jgi:hypothetical protein
MEMSKTEPKLNKEAALSLDRAYRRQLEAAFELTTLTFRSGSWKHMGFESFIAYVETLPKLKLNKDDQRLRVRQLIEDERMSQRQAAAALGISQETVRQRLKPPTESSRSRTRPSTESSRSTQPSSGNGRVSHSEAALNKQARERAETRQHFTFAFSFIRHIEQLEEWVAGEPIADCDADELSMLEAAMARLDAVLAEMRDEIARQKEEAA